MDAVRSVRGMLLIILVISSILLSCVSMAQTTPETTVDFSGPVRVQSVLAGDTLLIGSDRVVKLAGIDAPEPYNLGWLDAINPNRRVMADASFQYVKAALEGQEVRIEPVGTFRDSKGLILAYVFLADGTCLNEKLLFEGLAQILPGTPDHSRSAAFQTAQTGAQTAKKGIWSISADSGKIQIDANDVIVPEESKKVYQSPYSSETSEEASTSDFSGLIVLLVLIALVAGIFYLFKSLNAIKECPMCQEKMPRRALICPNCKYNEKTGFLGDAELQTWFTKNIRISKANKPVKRKKP